jgi:hypothetical protein
MYPHRIRLRGPWEILNPDGSKTRVDVPGGWSGLINVNSSISLVLQRGFGLPRTLDQDEDVYLVCDGGGQASLRLNDSTVSPEHVSGGVIEWKVTPLLRPRNVAELTVTPQPNSPQVTLEIRGPVFLRSLTEAPDGWTGRVIGENRPHMEVHLLAQGRVVERVSARANQPFALVRPLELPEGSYNPQAPLWTIELIELANRWWSVDVPTLP